MPRSRRGKPPRQNAVSDGDTTDPKHITTNGGQTVDRIPDTHIESSALISLTKKLFPGGHGR